MCTFGQSKIRASRRRGSKGGFFRCWRLSQSAQCLGCVNPRDGICIGTIPLFTFWQVLGLETVVLNLRPVCWPCNQYHAIYFVSPFSFRGQYTFYALSAEGRARAHPSGHPTPPGKLQAPSAPAAAGFAYALQRAHVQRVFTAPRNKRFGLYHPTRCERDSTTFLPKSFVLGKI